MVCIIQFSNEPGVIKFYHDFDAVPPGINQVAITLDVHCFHSRITLGRVTKALILAGSFLSSWNHLFRGNRNNEEM